MPQQLSVMVALCLMMQEYRSVKDKTIHHPRASWGTDEHQSMFGLPDWSLLDGFSSSSYIMLKREHETDDKGGSHHGNQLMVCIHNKVGFLAVAVLVNKTQSTAVGLHDLVTRRVGPLSACGRRVVSLLLQLDSLAGHCTSAIK